MFTTRNRLWTNVSALRSAVTAMTLTLLLAIALSPAAHALSMIATIGVGTGPHGVAVNPTTNRVHAVNMHDPSVSVIDGNTNTVIATVAVGDMPQDVAVIPSSNRVYVTNAFRF